MKHIENARKLRPVIEKAAASLDDQTASNAAALFPRLKQDGKLIAAGTRINWKGRIKKATADLWDTAENDPDNAPSLWADTPYRDGYRIIPDTLTVTTAFSKGELGWWKDVLYRSLTEGNVFTPDVHPDGWERAEV